MGSDIPEEHNRLRRGYDVQRGSKDAQRDDLIGAGVCNANVAL